MHQMSSSNSIVIYEIPGRYVTVVQGNSGVLYPFYRSTGFNSKSAETWFPWMGYFDAHPLQEQDIEYKNSIYMVKPNTYSISSAVINIIKKHLNNKALLFIARMGNDESLAISCCLGHGVWTKYPTFQKEIMASETIQKYLKSIEVSSIERTSLRLPRQRFVQFNGVYYSGIVKNVEALVAVRMENTVKIESRKYASVFSVQEKMIFPLTEELERLPQLSNNPSATQSSQTSALKNFGFIKSEENKQQGGEESSNTSSLNL